jgi:hypothetical protein
MAGLRPRFDSLPLPESRVVSTQAISVLVSRQPMQNQTL